MEGDSERDGQGPEGDTETNDEEAYSFPDSTEKAKTLCETYEVRIHFLVGAIDAYSVITSCRQCRRWTIVVNVVVNTNAGRLSSMHIQRILNR